VKRPAGNGRPAGLRRRHDPPRGRGSSSTATPSSRGFVSPDGPGGACLGLVEEHRITLLLSPAILAEMRDVLTRPFVRERRPDLTLELADRLLAALSYLAVVMRNVPRGPRYHRDEDDEPYMDLAVAGGADYLVTRDNDLLCLSTGHSVEAKQFRRRHQNQLRIVTPTDFLAQLEAGS
jgi:putative PIN family toxin of toxin-antitoxin system